MTFPILPISIVLFFFLNGGPCNSFNCLGHFKHDDDGAMLQRVSHHETGQGKVGTQRSSKDAQCTRHSL